MRLFNPVSDATSARTIYVPVEYLITQNSPDDLRQLCQQMNERNRLVLDVIAVGLNARRALPGVALSILTSKAAGPSPCIAWVTARAHRDRPAAIAPSGQGWVNGSSLNIVRGVQPRVPNGPSVAPTDAHIGILRMRVGHIDRRGFQ